MACILWSEDQCVQSREVMKRELKARQEANIRGLLSVMEVSQMLRAEQLAAPLQPNLVPVPPLVRALLVMDCSAVS